MRLLPILLLAFSVGCGSPFADAQKLDTVEAYEAFIKENPSSPYLTQAQVRVEEMMYEAAKASQDIKDWDAVLERFPEGKGQLYEKIWEERRQVLFNWADQVDTPEAWQRYIDEYPSGDRKKKQQARYRIEVANYLDKIEVGPIEKQQINLARDPDGPLNGWEFLSDVTWKGDEPVQYLNLRLSYLDADSNSLDSNDWPVVAEHLPGYLPFAEGFDTPMKKGDTRTWKWTTGDVPAGWAKKVTLKPVRIGFVKKDGDK